MVLMPPVWAGGSPAVVVFCAPAANASAVFLEPGCTPPVVLPPPAQHEGGGNRASKMLLDPQELLKLPAVEVVEGLATQGG
jgi:hypothetical protein